MNNKTTFSFLIIAGTLLLLIGSAILFAPQAMHYTNGVTLGVNPNLISEIRAPGGLLASSGLVILVGAFRRQFRRQAVLLASLIYGSYGVARLVSMMLDGMPGTSLVAATILELTLALAGLFILARSQTGTAWPEERALPKGHAFTTRRAPLLPDTPR